MRVCIIGKYPPIQGGVSMRTFWSAQDLAARGHEVHVVTNAKEVRAPYRMYMEDEDWRRAEFHPGPGSLRVHWTDPVDRSQRYIPMASPFVSKLASLAARAHEIAPFDVILSYYLEPYAVAGHLAAEMTGAPLVVQMAGSDAGKLWDHPQLGPLYDHIMRGAARVIAGGSVTEHAVAVGVAPWRIRSIGPAPVPEMLFSPDCPALDAVALAARAAADPQFADQVRGALPSGAPYFGVYGKLGDKKGSFELLRAMAKLAERGHEVGLLVMAHGLSKIENRFRAEVERLGLSDRVLQIPFLPHWRVPAFLSGCLAVCCLEQDFPITIHAPIVAREVLAAGKCLVGSREMIGKLPQPERLIDGYNCVVIEDAADSDLLTDRLGRILEDPAPTADLGRRARAYALDVQTRMRYAELLKDILADAAKRTTAPALHAGPDETDPGQEKEDRFPMCRMVWSYLEQDQDGPATRNPAEAPRDLVSAERLLSFLEQGELGSGCAVAPLVAAVRLDLAVEAAIDEAMEQSSENGTPPMERLNSRRWGLLEDSIDDMHPFLTPGTRIVSVPFAAADFISARAVADFPAAGSDEETFIAVCAVCAPGASRRFLIDAASARLLALCDGKKTVRELLKESGLSAHEDIRSWVRDLFEIGFISLGEADTSKAT